MYCPGAMHATLHSAMTHDYIAPSNNMTTVHKWCYINQSLSQHSHQTVDPIFTRGQVRSSHVPRSAFDRRVEVQGKSLTGCICSDWCCSRHNTCLRKLKDLLRSSALTLKWVYRYQAPSMNLFTDTCPPIHPHLCIHNIVPRKCLCALVILGPKIGGGCLLTWISDLNVHGSNHKKGGGRLHGDWCLLVTIWCAHTFIHTHTHTHARTRTHTRTCTHTHTHQLVYKGTATERYARHRVCRRSWEHVSQCLDQIKLLQLLISELGAIPGWWEKSMCHSWIHRFSMMFVCDYIYTVSTCLPFVYNIVIIHVYCAVSLGRSIITRLPA